MSEPTRYGLHSLRFKLVLASVLVEAVMLFVLVWNSSRITGNALEEIFQNRLATLAPMMTVALADPLAQRDYASLDERIGRIVDEKSVVYVELRDELGKIVASRGAVPSSTQRDSLFSVRDHVYDGALDIVLAGQIIGHARFGLNISLLEKTITGLRRQGAVVAATEIILTMLLLATLGALLTRHLSRLAQASHTLAGGDYGVRIDARGRDEVAETARAFNAMAARVEHDITERTQAEMRIERLAYHDELTGLPNRIALDRQLLKSIHHAATTRETLALMVMDMVDFRVINDTLGHQNGDSLLIQVAERLRATLWESDMVARLGGDEFAVLLPHLAHAEHIDSIVKKVAQALEVPFQVAGVMLDVQMAIGIALYPEHGEDANLLLSHADIAMYEAKEKQQTSALYDPATDHTDSQQLALITELRQAIHTDQLTLHYQPVLSLATGKPVGMEALVRWPHPTRGMIFPDQFIPMAEHTGLIHPLTLWVLRSALRQLQVWRNAGHELYMAVNLSVVDLRQPQIVANIQQILAEYAVPAKLLVLEITESAVMLDPIHAQKVLRTLRDLGIQLSVDDFGIGHASLVYLKTLPFHKLKVDKSFVMDLDDDDNAAIVLSVIELAHRLNLSVTAEGVEDQSILDQLRLFNCDTAQGYFICRPVPIDAINAWLQEQSG